FKQFQKQRTSSTTSTESTILDELMSNIEVDKLGSVSIDAGREISSSFSTSENSSPYTDYSSLPSKTIISSESQPLRKIYFD
ncbi:unnamed protein product, partial [Rotaria sordida]